ncbi:MAG: hypothetical protein IPL79_09865 [Myxococcales bacterium]|nr:hypothetical protein [Myxococcales bacterium]
MGTPHRKAKDGSRRGGKRPGAGRKPNGEVAMVSHLRRPSHNAAHPLHSSMKVQRPACPICASRGQHDASRGAFRIAKAVNRELGRDGKVWRGRYSARRLCVPKEVRNALVYVRHDGCHTALGGDGEAMAAFAELRRAGLTRSLCAGNGLSGQDTGYALP